MGKKLNIKMKTNKNSEEWIKKGSELLTQEKKQDKMKRLTLDITENLHKRIKSKCVAKGVNMVEELRKILEKEFLFCEGATKK